MLKNIFLELEYDGTGYFGWQIQNKKSPRHHVTRSPEERTVQGEVERALKKLFKKEIRVVSAGRTDRGVHAKGQCVNFKVNTKIPLKNIKTALNSFLPNDIFITKIKKVSLGFHARFDAKSKIYRYLISTNLKYSVFSRNYAWYLPEYIDVNLVKKTFPYLLGKKNFSCFAKEASKYKTCVREIKSLSVDKKKDLLCIDIEASGFLRNMVRNLVYFLVCIGKKKIPLKNVDKIIRKKISYTNKPAPGCGLYLLKVNYE